MLDRQGLIEQLKKDEGFSSKAKWDNKQFSYGYGTRAPGPGATITREQAEVELAAKLDEAIGDFNRIFKDHLQKFDPVRAACFVQLIYNMGPGRKDAPSMGGLYSFVNTLKLIFNKREVPWLDVAEGLKRSLWFRQVGKSGDVDGPGPKQGRGERIVQEVATGVRA